MVVNYEEQMHRKNQKRISIGLKCILIIPLIFLALLFWTNSSKNYISHTLDCFFVRSGGLSDYRRIYGLQSYGADGEAERK